MKLLSPYWPAIHFIGFLLVWAGPMLYYGLTDRPASWLPPELRIYYRLAALFTHRTGDWYDRHIQVRTAANSQWVTLDVSDYVKVCVQMPSCGHIRPEPPKHPKINAA